MGARVYYNKRSQPPYFGSMVLAVYQATDNLTFVEEMLPAMEMEFTFWLTKRQRVVLMPNGDNYTVYEFHTQANMPRPESYKEDWEMAKYLTTSGKLFALFR